MIGPKDDHLRKECSYVFVHLRPNGRFLKSVEPDDQRNIRMVAALLFFRLLDGASLEDGEDESCDLEVA